MPIKLDLFDTGFSRRARLGPQRFRTCLAGGGGGGGRNLLSQPEQDALKHVLPHIDSKNYSKAAQTLLDEYIPTRSIASVLKEITQIKGETHTLPVLQELFKISRFGREHATETAEILGVDLSKTAANEIGPAHLIEPAPVKKLSIEALIASGDFNTAAAMMIDQNIAPGMIDKYLKNDPAEAKRMFVLELDALSGNNPARQKTAAIVALLLIKEKRPELQININQPSSARPSKSIAEEEYRYRINNAVKKGQFAGAAGALRDAYDIFYKTGEHSMRWLAELLCELSNKEKINVLTALYKNLSRPEAAQEIVQWIDQDEKIEKEKRS